MRSLFIYKAMLNMTVTDNLTLKTMLK